ncbi:MAG: HAMP domain-containing sensor histidine kinase [Cyanobacteria bacterium]|nr:HAMP domain-containing sensor histidine kinase [Cyanobacteriota bacterium]MDA0865961.1 HAMP domain-containing sensor histidine kinase [Cyanobacteriota bacterium]
MSQPSLRSRLFWSYLMVLMVGIVTLATVGWLYSPRLFVVYLQRIEGRNFSVGQVRAELVQGFQFAWGRGMVWAGLLGGLAASGTSYWLARRIVRPLEEIETITRQFAAGELEQRLPDYEIPELTQLAQSVNHMAADLAGVEQRRRELVGDLSHELRTPLTIIRGYLEGLADGTVAAEPVVYERLNRETQRLQRLVNDLQELSQLESGYLPIHRQALAICPLLQSVVARFQDQQLPDAPVQLALNCADGLPQVMADPERLEQILVNLLTNALRHTATGQVTVTTWAQPPQLWIAVTDTGVGIAAADLPHVFDRFWRADAARDRRSGGTGIGLTICHRLVTLQGGQITVTSTVGSGSTFQFWLPINTESRPRGERVQLG